MFFQALERRQMLSASADYDGHSTLTINGTSGNDTLDVQLYETFAPNPLTRTWHVNLNGDDNAFETPFIFHVNIHGNGGNDKFRVDDIASGVIAKVYGGSGNDKLTVTNQHRGSEVNFSAGAGSNTLEYGGTDVQNGVIDPQKDYELTSTKIEWDGTPYVNFSGITKLNFTSTGFDDKVKVLSVGAGQTFNVDALGGDDVITVGNGNIVKYIKGALNIDGGSIEQAFSGDDTLVFDDTKSIGASDTLSTNSFNKTSLGTPIKSKYIDHQTLNGSIQSDFITVASCSLQSLKINSGGGNDTIKIGSASAGLGSVAKCAISVDGGAGNDLVDANDAAHVGVTNYTVTPTKFSRTGIVDWSLSHLEKFNLESGKSGNNINATTSAVPVVVHAGAGNDSVWGSAFDDVLFAAGGSDIVNGFAGNDQIDGGDGDDILYGGLGNDLIKGLAGKDNITGDAGFDSLAGGTGNDSIFAKDGEKDFYDGGPGEDTIKKDGVDASNTAIND